MSQLDEAAEFVRSRAPAPPEVGMVLGSGLGAVADSLESCVKIPYGEIPHMPAPKVSGHAGMLCIGEVSGVTVAMQQGRSHLYEGHEPDRVVFGVRLLARLGCFAVLLTNAAGGIRTSFRPGSLMLIGDHLNLTGKNPLLGPNESDLGPRFPDMTRAYDQRLGALARDAAADVGIRLEEGVYAAVHGPSYETPAEIHMLRTMGADAVGMSTVPEVIALRHMGVRTAAVSCITNQAAGMSPTLLDHTEVERTAGMVRGSFVKLLSAWLRRIGEADWDHATSRSHK
ncbi:purine-nucleoside phosphorylase [Desulfobulbus sp. AH-315-M07]|nr:purine-nucleoside phosphorylase [Desulfobulbus sp. AH-315-M07]